ncbi:UV DNA damage repair endonuclease UvsE [Aureimonas flava]|uniref:UV DNA damage repair endonuclease UvsE n=2 Tax=Aureimonas flava TaxID=2320271 RepID=A0A3A1WSR8_9HYPH|nr:UV DNA damage repair endonuclease UvsE [Aureimonas flava]RIY03775.1 UV DNA damage repair endonuclease UvsE [Aureimonas flava]
MGRDDLPSNDARRSGSNPHLKVSLEYVDRILDYCAENGIGLYRMSSDLAPYATHPDLPQFHGMVRESGSELAAVGAKARALGLRLSFHPSQFIVLNSPDPSLVSRSVWDLASQAEMLDLMGLGPEAVLVIHVGGTYGDVATSRERWVRTWETLPEPVRRRLVLEHDDLRFSASDTLWIHERTGVRLVFDHQHFWCLNPDGLDLRATVLAMVGTWPLGEVAKVHYSSPRTQFLERRVVDKGTGRKGSRLVPPVTTGHADFVNPFEFAQFLSSVEGVAFDVMLEAKAKDVALFRLRGDVVRYAPWHGSRFGLGGPA